MKVYVLKFHSKLHKVVTTYPKMLREIKSDLKIQGLLLEKAPSFIKVNKADHLRKMADMYDLQGAIIDRDYEQDSDHDYLKIYEANGWLLEYKEVDL